MVSNATSALSDVDLLVVLIEEAKQHRRIACVKARSGAQGAEVRRIVQSRSDQGQHVVASNAGIELNVFDQIVPLSALKEDGVASFRDHVFQRLPLGKHFFAEDEVTDQTERFLVEIVREKLMRQLGDEIPHSATVVIEHFKQGDKVINIHADIIVERDGQKRIVIGKNGARLKLIGQEARKDIELMLDHQIMLHLWVKVRKGWTNNAAHLRNLGYD